MSDRNENSGRRIHLSLVEAHDDAEAWKHEAARVIAKARDEPRYYLACENGPCDQGRKLCLTPKKCQTKAAKATAGLPWHWVIRLTLIVLLAAGAYWIAKQ